MGAADAEAIKAGVAFIGWMLSSSAGVGFLFLLWKIWDSKQQQKRTGALRRQPSITPIPMEDELTGGSKYLLIRKTIVDIDRHVQQLATEVRDMTASLDEMSKVVDEILLRVSNDVRPR